MLEAIVVFVLIVLAAGSAVLSYLCFKDARRPVEEWAMGRYDGISADERERPTCMVAVGIIFAILACIFLGIAITVIVL